MCLTYFITKNDVFILFLFFYVASAASSNPTDIILIHVLFRHGERTPDEFYPTDPHQNNDFYPIGLSGLTNRGKLTEFNLGNILRTEYGDLLGDYYTPNKISTRSTEKLRAQMSALLVLAGMLPPNSVQMWHPTISWQPIPIYFKPSAEEDLLDSAHCRYYSVIRTRYSNNETLQKIVQSYTETFNYVTNNSGMPINDLVDLQRFYFILATEEEIGLKLPEWTKHLYPEPIYSAVSKLYGYLNSDLTAKQINAGYLLKKMLNDCIAKISGINGDKLIYLYSAHDTTLGYFLDALTTLPHHIPRYGSAVILELHKHQNNSFVKELYRVTSTKFLQNVGDTNFIIKLLSQHLPHSNYVCLVITIIQISKLRYLKTPTIPHIEDLKLPNCPILCPINQFIQLHSNLLPNITYRQMCDYDHDTV